MFSTTIQKIKLLLTPLIWEEHEYIPTLDFYLLNTYLGDYNYTNSDSLGDYFCLLLSNDVPEDTLYSLRSHKWYVYEYDPSEDTIMIILKIPGKYKKTVVNKFSEGKYSKMSISYFTKYFKKGSVVYMICTRNSYLRNYWESLIGQPLPKNAEVWSKIKEEDELFNYAKITEFQGTN